MRGRQQADTERRLSNVVLIGTVSQVDHKLNRYRVKAGDLESDWIASAVTRSGGTRTFESRDVGEQVVVVSPSGDLSQGVIVGAVATEERQAGAEGWEHRTIYPDGTVVEYDDDAHAFRVSVPEGGGAVSITSGGEVSIEGARSVAVKSAESVQVQATTIRLAASGDVDIESANLRHNGKNIGADHIHTGVEPGGGMSGPPA